MIRTTRRDVLRGGGVGLLAIAAPLETGTAAPAAVVEGATPRVLTRLVLNGTQVRAEHAARATLLDWLREEMALTGTKKGCNEGACGACTVLVDGRRVNACMTLVAAADGAAVTTIEGLAAPDGALHPVQQAFLEQDALQCGYCTPGQVMSAVGCIAEGRATDPETIAEWMSGNICRCSAYPQIVAAVEIAAARTEG